MSPSTGSSPRSTQQILGILGRAPNLVELGIFSVMWSEHCSYKSSKIHLGKFPTEAPWVVCGPGENAGVVDIGDGLVAIFKMESHNHPSFIEPYQGAATGVGGILRDVFTMGARPVALLDALRFGDPAHPKTRHLLSGVVAGIGGYGNCVGVPTVGGECTFHRAYNGNILVNAMCVGVARADRVFYAKASGVGNPVVYVGAKTGRDGIHGATMASAEFSDETEAKRPTVQVGDPFTEKLLIEACLELMEHDCIVAIQDMGAAGLTSSSFEMAARGEAGILLDLDRVPLRETGMTPYEIMLSESQERMLMVLQDGREARRSRCSRNGAWTSPWSAGSPTAAAWCCAGRARWSPTCRWRRSAAPRRSMSGPHLPTPKRVPLAANDREAVIPHRDALLRLAGRARPRQQALDLGAVRPHGHGRHRAAAGRRCRGGARARHGPRPRADDRLHPALLLRRPASRRACRRWRRPGAISSRSAPGRWRSPTASISATPSDRLVMGQLVGCIEGMAKACRALDFPVVSGNVSLYNETDGNAILPTPNVGGLGVIDDLGAMVGIAWTEPGSVAGAARRVPGLARQLALLASGGRPRRRRAAAGRSGGRAAHGRVPAGPDRGWPDRRLP